MASTYLSRTPSSAGNRKTWTFSAWIKRSKLSIVGSTILFAANSSAGSNDEDAIAIEEANNPRFLLNNGNGSSIKPSRLLRDTSAWYHIVVAVDTTQATASNRVKYYFNGELETSFSQENYPSQNYDCKINNNVPHGIGFINDTAGGGNSAYFDGSMSHVHFIDGTAYDASAFGEYDANGVWTINTSPSVTYGTNGFFVLKDGNSVTDQSGNGNNWTVSGGTLTNTEDNPSNVFATINPLDRAINGTAPTFAYGNTQWTASGNSTSNNAVRGTLGNSNGKYYFEAKLLEASNTMIGVHLTSVSPFYDGDGYMGSNSGFYAIYINGTDTIYAIVGGSNQNVSLGSVTNNDIIGCAFDFDNNKFYFSKNGTWLNSGDPTSGATGTGSFGTLASGLYVPGITNVSWTTASSTAFNFGNGYFGTTAVASAGTNASGNGIFEYDVPTGYTALSTKGLNL